MLNVAFVFADAIDALDHHGDNLDIPALPPALFMMQRDVINHYRHALEHYFTISLDEPYLLHSSHGAPYQKWAFFVNQNWDVLSLMIQQLLQFTSRMIHESKIKAMFDENFQAAKNASNRYIGPLCAMRNSKIGIVVHEDQRLVVTSIRAEPRSERVRSKPGTGNELRHYLISIDPHGNEVETLISEDDFKLHIEAVSRTTYDIRDRKVLREVKEQGLGEVGELETLCQRFGQICNRYCSHRELAVDFTNLNESYWVTQGF